jgi:hypothetical protein
VHAWLESKSSVAVGASEVPYVPLASLSERLGTTTSGHDPRFWRAEAKRRAI